MIETIWLLLLFDRWAAEDEDPWNIVGYVDTHDEAFLWVQNASFIGQRKFKEVQRLSL